MKPFRTLLAAASCLALSGGAAHAAEIVVATSIKPVHSLVAAVMEGVGAPELILQGAGSPHAYSLRPSQARLLSDADLVFWVGPSLEVFLAKPLEQLAGGGRLVTLAEADGLTLLDLREGGAFEAHAHGEEHDDHDHEGEAAHDDHDDDDHDDDDHAHQEDDHADEHAGDHGDHDHDHDAHDAHIWLDPDNARAMTRAIAEALSEADPDNTAAYAANAARLEGELDALEAEVTAELASVRDRPFIVFHDAYQYFENRFGLAAAGSITVSPEVIPGAQRVDEIHAKIKSLQAACVFSEPQFEPRLVRVVTEGTDAKAGVLDPLGAEIADGPGLYPALIRGMAASLKDCLSPQS